MTTENNPEMTASESFFLSPMLSITITITPTSMLCKWEPEKQPSLTDAEAECFRKARDLMMVKQAAMRRSGE